jgi:integrase
MGAKHVKRLIMATPYEDPRTHVLYFRRGIPEGLRAAFDGRAVFKVSLRTKDSVEAKSLFAVENAKFEGLLKDARQRLAEGTLSPTPGALVRRWAMASAVGANLSGSHRLLALLMELDAAIPATITASSTCSSDRWAGVVVHCGPNLGGGPKVALDDDKFDDAIFPPPVFVDALSCDWARLQDSRTLFQARLDGSYGGNVEKVGSNWIRARWFGQDDVWRPALSSIVLHVRRVGEDVKRFGDEDLAAALLTILDDIRPGDVAINRERLGANQTRRTAPRLKPDLRLKMLFVAWKKNKNPRPQSANEYESAVDDFIDFVGDLPVVAIDSDLLYDFRDACAKMPPSMPREDRKLPFRARLQKHTGATETISPKTLKKRVGALQALLSFAHGERWISSNVGIGIKINNYTKNSLVRVFEDEELARLFSAPLFTQGQSWKRDGAVSSCTLFWILLIAGTTGARLEEIGQATLADVKSADAMTYLDITPYGEPDSMKKSVKNDGSIRLVPIHQRLVGLGFQQYCDAIKSAGETQLFPELRPNSVGKRTKEVSRLANRLIDKFVADDPRLVEHSLRHTFKAKGNDAEITDRTLDQICGHAPVSTGGRYGARPRIRTLHNALHKIDFDCIDWASIEELVRTISWPDVAGPSSSL